MSFIKVKENFTCAHCGTKVTGSGYTNHCPNCLYSKHVDESSPGDRASSCNGLMKPVGVEVKSGQSVLIHKCVSCGKTTKNKTVENDNKDLFINLSSKPSPTKQS